MLIDESLKCVTPCTAIYLQNKAAKNSTGWDLVAAKYFSVMIEGASINSSCDFESGMDGLVGFVNVLFVNAFLFKKEIPVAIFFIYLLEF